MEYREPEERRRAIEERIRTRPGSPLFTRRAASLLIDDRPDEALKILLEGLRHFPEYPTGYFLAAKAQVLLRRYNDARASLSRLLELAPTCPAASELLEKLTELELAYPPFDTFELDRPSPLPPPRSASQRPERKGWSRSDDLIPVPPAFAAHRPETPPAPTDASAVPGPEESDEQAADPGLDFELLASELDGAKIPALPEDESALNPIETPAPDAVNLHSRPVTETLAAIYVQQGRYEEAIEAYRMLRERYPERGYEFAIRIAELGKIVDSRDRQPS